MARNPIEKDFIICPLPLIENLMADGSTLSDIFACGLITRAKSFSPNVEKAKQQLIYDYFGKDASIPESLIGYMRNYDPRAYSPQDFKSGRISTQQIMDCLNKSDFEDKFTSQVYDLILWYQCRSILIKCAISLNNLPILFDNAPKWFNFDNSSRYHGVPTFLVNAKLALDLNKQRYSMTEERRALWAYYFAILSIIGTKSWTSTTSMMIKARLAGANSPKDINDKMKKMSEQQLTLYKKYTSRRYYDKLMRELQEMGSIVEYGANRHTYISTKLTLKQLMTQVITRTGVSKAKRLSNEKSKLKAEIMAELEAQD